MTPKVTAPMAAYSAPEGPQSRLPVSPPHTLPTTSLTSFPVAIPMSAPHNAPLAHLVPSLHVQADQRSGRDAPDGGGVGRVGAGGAGVAAELDERAGRRQRLDEAAPKRRAGRRVHPDQGATVNRGMHQALLPCEPDGGECACKCHCQPDQPHPVPRLPRRSSQ